MDKIFLLLAFFIDYCKLIFFDLLIFACFQIFSASCSLYTSVFATEGTQVQHGAYDPTAPNF
jgi:hypothetical protein